MRLQPYAERPREATRSVFVVGTSPSGFRFAARVTDTVPTCKLASLNRRKLSTDASELKIHRNSFGLVSFAIVAFVGDVEMTENPSSERPARSDVEMVETPESERPTRTFIAFLVSFLAWGGVGVIILQRAMTGAIHGSPVARYFFYVTAMASLFVLAHFAKKDHAQGATKISKLNISLMQSLFILFFLVACGAALVNVLGV